MTFVKNSMAQKTMRLLECQHTLAYEPDFRLCTLSKFLKIAGIFWLCFLLDTVCISEEDFLPNAGMCFGGVAVAIDTVLSLKGKILLRINKSWVQISHGMSQKCSDQNTKIARFYPWTVTTSYFSGTNDRIETENFCCLVSCSKRLHKWKSWSLGAGSNSSSIVASIIKAQWQLFDSDYRNCKPVEKTRPSMTH